MSDPFPDDETLVAGLRRGDRLAWDTFVRRYERLIFSVPRRMGLDAAESADVMQDVLIAFLRGLPRLREARTVPRWLTRTAFRVARDRRARLRRETPSEDPAHFAEIADEADISDLVARTEDAARVRSALRALGGRCEELLELLFLSEPPLPYDEIAARLGRPIGSLGPTRRRCLEQLLDRLGDQVEGTRIRAATRPTLPAKPGSAKRRPRRIR